MSPLVSARKRSRGGFHSARALTGVATSQAVQAAPSRSGCEDLVAWGDQGELGGYRTENPLVVRGPVAFLQIMRIYWALSRWACYAVPVPVC